MSSLVPYNPPPEEKLPKIFAQINLLRTEVVVMLGSETFRRKENAEKIFDAAQKYRLKKNKETLGALMELLDDTIATRSLFGGTFQENIKTGNLYLTGSQVPVPKFLVDRLKEAHEKKYPQRYLVNFWVNLLLNPYQDVRDNMFEYCLRYNVPITDLGYMVMYKAVKFKSKPNVERVAKEDLAHFVATAYDIVKNKRRKKLVDYKIMYSKDKKEYLLVTEKSSTSDERIGNLEELYSRLDELSAKSQVVYTDKWTGKMDIKLGMAVRKDYKQARPTNQTVLCTSFGVHAGGFEYVKRYGNKSDVVLMVLVNPRDMTYVHTNEAKIQTSQYFPVAVMEQNNVDTNETHYGFDDIDQSYYESGFADHEQREMTLEVTKSPEGYLRNLFSLRESALSVYVQGESISLLPEYREEEEDEDASQW